jgi:hypothetical protein
MVGMEGGVLGARCGEVDLKGGMGGSKLVARGCVVGSKCG